MADMLSIDDPSIINDAQLWRRIWPGWRVPDSNRGGFRITSAAFDNSKGTYGMSVLIEEVVRAAGRSAADLLCDYPNYGIAYITAHLARECNQSLTRDPTPAEPAHASVVGRKPKSVQRRFAESAIWIINVATNET